jgi:hypothetical protein
MEYNGLQCTAIELEDKTEWDTPKYCGLIFQYKFLRQISIIFIHALLRNLM